MHLSLHLLLSLCNRDGLEIQTDTPSDSPPENKDSPTLDKSTQGISETPKIAEHRPSSAPGRQESTAHAQVSARATCEIGVNTSPIDDAPATHDAEKYVTIPYSEYARVSG